MNSPAIRQNTNSWPQLFADHLHQVTQRSAAALAKAGYDSLLLHAGTPPLLFLDAKWQVVVVQEEQRCAGFLRFLQA